MDATKELLNVLEEVLCLNGSSADMASDSPLLGAFPQLDSVAVVAIITALEDRFGFMIADDELDGSDFATVGTLARYINGKLNS